MAKKSTVYVCQNCSYQTPKWMGKCPECESWNSFVEETTAPAPKDLNRAHKRAALGNEVPQKINEIEFETKFRVKTSWSEFDRVVGGGVVPGSLILIGGEPGIGKSTLLTTVMGNLSKLHKDDTVLYVSGEESVTQVAERTKIVGVHE